MNLHSIIADSSKPIWMIRCNNDDGYPMTWFVQAHTRRELDPVIRTIQEAMPIDNLDVIQMDVNWIETPDSIIQNLIEDYGLEETDDD